jgi:arylsulfatase A-like enzyme
MRFLALVLLLVASSLSATAASPRPLNIVLLYADDWRFDTLGVAGHPVVHTPNLDRLAASGVRFTQAAVTTAICGVSRASLFTGQWMSRHGNPGFVMFKTPWEDTYPGRLRAAGYTVAHVGKWHNGTFPAEHYDFGRSYMGEHWITKPNGSKVHVTQQNETDALEFLRTRDTAKPFSLMVSFFAPHAEDRHPLQYLPQPSSYDWYGDVTIPVPPTATEEAFRRLPEFIANDKNEGRNRWTWRFDTPGKYQEMMKNYYRLVSEVDATCGRILEELERQGLLDSTLVIFTTDNGYYHGERGLADKWYPHQESIRVPLIVRDPRLPAAQRGTTRDEFALNVDLAPTILAAAGLEAPAVMQGRDFSPLYLAAAKPAWRDEFFYEHAIIRNADFIPASEALVRRHEKYFYWPDFQREQLFDLAADPHEQHDLAKDPAQSARLAALRARFNELKQSSQ